MGITIASAKVHIQKGELPGKVRSGHEKSHRKFGCSVAMAADIRKTSQTPSSLTIPVASLAKATFLVIFSSLLHVGYFFSSRPSSALVYSQKAVNAKQANSDELQKADTIPRMSMDLRLWVLLQLMMRTWGESRSDFQCVCHQWCVCVPWCGHLDLNPHRRRS